MIKATLKQIRGDYKAGGLDLSIPSSPTDYSLQQFGGVSLGEVPDKDFEVPNIPPVKDQGSTDFCVAFESSYTVEQDYGLYLSASFLFAVAKKRYFNGDYSGFGLGLQQGLGVLQHDGVCKEDLYPFTGSRNQMANWKNISESAWQDASTRKMNKGYFLVDIYKDKYKNFVAGMYHWQEMIITGIQWYSGFYVDSKGRLILNKTGGSVGHSIGTIGRKTIDGVKGIQFINSYLDKPKFWLSEDQVRQEIFYGYICLPIERPIVELIKKYAGKSIMSKARPDVYVVIGGEKRPLPNEITAWSWGIRLWQDVVTIPDEELNSIPTGEPLNMSDGNFFPIINEIINKYKLKF